MSSTIQEARRQVESARRQLEQQREKTKRISIERTQAQLRAQDLAGKTKFAEEQKRVSSAKSRMLEQIGVKERELSSYEKQIQEVESAQARQENLTKAIKEYARVGGSAGGDVEGIYKKYGRDIASKAAKIVESHKTRGLGDFQYKGTYISPEGYGMSISQEALGKGISEGTIISGGTYRSMGGDYTRYGNVPTVKTTLPAYENIFTGERIYESRVDVPVGYKEIRVTKEGRKIGEVAIPGTDIITPTKYETTKRAKESYQPVSGMYVSEPSGIPEGGRGTLFMRPPTPQERYEMELQKQREKEIPMKVIKKGYSLFGKPYVEKRVKEGEIIIGASGFLFGKTAPYVEKGYEKIEPYAKEYLKGEYERRIGEAEGILGVGSFLFKTTTPYVKKGYEKTKPYVVEYFKGEAEKRVKEGKVILGAGGWLFKETKPYVEKGYEKATPYIESYARSEFEKRKEQTQNILGAGGFLFEKTTPIVKKGYEKTKPYVKQFYEEGFLPTALPLKFLEAKREGKPTVSMFGQTLQSYEGKGIVYSTYLGTLDLIEKGSEYVSYKSGFGEFRAELIKTAEEKKKTRYAPSFLMSEIEARPIDVSVTEEEIRKSSKEFAGSLRGAIDFGTYLTPIAPVKIVGGMAEATFGGLGIPEAPKGIVEFAKKEPWDVGYVGTLGLLRGGRAVGRIGRKVFAPKISTVIEEVKGYKPVLISRKQPIQVRQGEKVTTIYKDVFVKSKTPVTIGKKTIIESWRGKPVYGGTYQLDKEGYERALKLLKKQGYTEAQAKIRLRETKPKSIKGIFKGDILVTEGETGMVVDVKGVEKLRPTVEILPSGTKTRGGKGTIEYIDTSLEPTAKGEYLKGELISKKAYLTKEGRPYSKLTQVGKTTTTYDIRVGAKKIKEVGEIKFYKTAGLSQQKIPKKVGVVPSEGWAVIKEGKPQVIIDVDEMYGIRKDVGFVSTSGKKSSPEYSKQLYSLEKPQQALASVSTIVSKPTPIKTPKIPTVTITEVKPTTISPVISTAREGLEQSQYYGKGVYERTEEYGAMPGQLGQVRVTDLSKDRMELLSIQKPEVSQKPISVLKGRLEERGEYRFDLGLAQKEKTKLKEMEKLKEKTSAKEILGLLTKAGRGRTPIETKPTPPRPERTPKKIPPIIPKKEPQVTEELKEKAEDVLDVFKVFVTKKGEDIELGGFKGLPKAEERLRGELLGTLRAGGYVTKRGKKIKINLGAGFRPSKIDPFKVVQLKEKRLGRMGETEEIQFFRKQKRGQKLI